MSPNALGAITGQLPAGKAIRLRFEATGAATITSTANGHTIATLASTGASWELSAGMMEPALSTQQYTVISAVNFERVQGAQNRAMYGRKQEEFLCDFMLIAKRTLREGSPECQIFKFHFLLGADRRLLARKLAHLGLALEHDRSFFRYVYNIEAKLGRSFRDTRPYGIFPLDEYFGGVVTVERVRPIDIPADKPTPVRAPLAA